tara:strand:+ start:144 stop:365 length:222 start_codon:yes stop_codon:yes gene_type:complete
MEKFMETYDSDDDPDYEPNESSEEDDTIEFSCPDCLYLEIEKDKLINQLAKFMTLYKHSMKKIKILETQLKKK